MHGSFADTRNDICSQAQATRHTVTQVVQIDGETTREELAQTVRTDGEATRNAIKQVCHFIFAREFTSLTGNNARYPLAHQVRQLLLLYFQFTESHASRADAPIRTRSTI